MSLALIGKVNRLKKLKAERDAKRAATGRQLQQQKDAIARCYEVGGADFLERVRRYGCTYKPDTELQLTPVFKELLLIIGDFRIADIYTTGPAQCGKTLAHVLLVADTVICLRLDTGWFYHREKSLDENVPEQFRPVADRYCDRVERATQTRIRRKGDRRINKRMQYGGYTAIFSFASTSRPSPKRTNKAAVDSAGVSFSPNLLINEERSQWPDGIDFSARLEASAFVTRPKRDLGTPGGGGGIEAGMVNLDRYFYPHYQCPSCGAIAPLDPKGCLLRPMKRRTAAGQVVTDYLTESGRPIEKSEYAQGPGAGETGAGWWHTDPLRAVETAYIGCSQCGHPLPEDLRINAHLHCKQTGQTALDYLEAIPPGVPERKLRVAIHLSPLTREGVINQATELIADGLGLNPNSSNPDDWQQQKLGHPSTSGQSGVTEQMIRNCIAAPRINAGFDVIVAGCDQGRNEDWLWVMGVLLPFEHESLSIAQICDRAIRTVLLASDLNRDEVLPTCDHLGVSLGAWDNEPDRAEIAALCADSPFVMVDQRDQRDDIREGKVASGGREYDCYLIDNQGFQTKVLNNFLLLAEDGYPLYRLPEVWQRWYSMPSAEKSPLRHLTAPKRDPIKRRWARPTDNIDDLWFAAADAEVALMLWLLESRGLIELELQQEKTEEENHSSIESFVARRRSYR